MIKTWKNLRKIVIFHFLENFCTTGRKTDKKHEKMKKWIKMIKNDKKMIKKDDKINDEKWGM